MRKSLIKLYSILICLCITTAINAQDSGNFIWPSDYRVLNPRSPVASWGGGDDWCYDNGWFHVQIYFENSERATHHYYVKRGDVNRIWRRRSSISIMREFVSKSSDLTVKYHGKNGNNSFGEFVLSESVDLQTDNYTATFVSEEGAYNAISKDHSNDVTFILHLLRFKYQLVYDGNGNTGGTVPATWKSDKWVDDGFTGPTIQKQSDDKGIWDYADDCSYSWPHELATPNLTKPAYTHVGWSYTKNGAKIEGGSANITGTGHAHINDDSNPVSTTVYAVWAANPYTATFNANGGSVSPASTNYTIESTFTFPTPTREGWKFSSWKVTSVGSDSNGWTVGSTYAAGATSPSGAYGNVTFEAQWTPLYKFSLTYDVNGGTGGPSPSTVTSGSDWLTANTYTFTISSTKPTRENYTFLGWYDALTGGTEIGTTYTVTGVGGSTAAKTIYAYWKINSHKVTGTIDHGTVSNNNQEVIHNQQSTAMLFTPATGYEITGVTEKLGTGSAAAVSGLTYPLSSYTYPATTVTKDIAVAATTTPITYTLTFVPGENGTVDPASKTYNITQSVTLPTPTKAGHTFTGWKVTTAGGNWSTSDAVYTGTVSAGKYGNATLTAQWTINKYDVTGSIDNGGNVSNSSQKGIEYGSSSTAMVFTPAAGYAITSVTEKLGTGSAAAVSGLTYPLSSYTYPAMTVTQDIAVAATTSPVTYRVTYDANGTNVSGCPASLDYTIVSTSTLAVPTRPGFGFNGWKATSVSEGSWTKDSSYEGGLSLTGKYGNVTLQAQWTEGGYTATFNADGGTVSPASASFKVTGKLELPEPAWKGHTFKGWKVTSESAGSWTKGDTFNAGELSDKWGDVTFTAQWDAIPTGDLKITVKGLEDGDGAVCTVVSAVDGSEYTVAVTSDDNTATLKNLFAGSCTVTSTGWQWNYDISESNPKTTTVKGNETVTVTFTLAPKSGTPKHDEDNVVNVLIKQ